MIIAITMEGGNLEYFRKMGYCVDFLDNGFVQCKMDIDKFKEKIKEKKPNYAILPDNNEFEAMMMYNDFPDIQWIYPLHDIGRLPVVLGFSDFVGFPHRKEWRNYTLTTILEEAKNQPLWYLGYWDSVKVEMLKYFRGMDTTMSIKLAVKNHKYWKRPGQHSKAPPGKDRHELVLENMQRFINYIRRSGY